MTLVEVVLVLFIFFILAGMLLPLGPRRGRPARIMSAKVEMAGLVNAIEAYETDYNHLPLEVYSTNEDVTLGFCTADFQDYRKIRGTRLVETNSDLIIVLMDIDAGINAGHKQNLKRVKYLNAKLSGDTNSPGVGIDYLYRDPWGHQFVISLDANQDGLVRDAFYSYPKLFSTNAQTSLTNTNGVYELRGKVMVWSRGPDGKASFTAPAKAGFNKDNVVSWE